jgi:cold shock CspA family protein
MTDIDASFEAARQIIDSARERLNEIVTEEDAKFQLISRLLTEALGWNHEDVSAERKNENGYSDYILSDHEHDALVVEAKRIGLIEVGTQARTKQNYKISGPALKNAIDGVAQAASYATPLGIQLAVLTDGVTWIVFLPYVPGARYQDRQAVCFPGLDSVLTDYASFYELLSKESYRKGIYKIIFDKIHENRLIQSATLVSPVLAEDIFIEQKSALAFDLEKVFAGFFSNLAGDDDPDLLINCFVETRESRVADFSLERITANVLGNIVSPDKTVDEGLNLVVESAVESAATETVFIVGPSGAGKTTFLDRFFKKTLSSEIRSRCLVLKVSALDATGDEQTAIPWITNKIIELLEEQLFEDGAPTWNELLGLYHGEYLKRAKGQDARLYARDKEAFKDQFSQYMDQQVAQDREGYMQRLLRDAVNNRHMLPVFVIDNTDEFGISYKEKIFQYFQAASRAAKKCLMIFPATDKSAWTFSKTDIFNIYSSKSFFLPTPSPREVFRRRVDYLKGKLTADGGSKKNTEYLAGKGIKITIRDLEAFASVVENIFVDQDYAAKRMGELSNYNMRMTLKLSKRVITSSVLKIDDIVKSYIIGQAVTPSVEVFMNALLKGDYSFYRRDDDHGIFPIFEVDNEVRQSPLLALRVLTLLREAQTHAFEDKQRYMTVRSIYRYFDLMAYAEISVERCVIALLEARLIEPYDLSMKDYSQDQRVAITYSGLAHTELALYNANFFEQMALTNRIVDADVAAKIRSAYFRSGSYNERLEEVRGIFAEYLAAEDERFCLVPETSEFAVQKALRATLVDQWRGPGKVHIPEQELSGLAGEGVLAIVDKFDDARGYGFVSIPDLHETAFLHVRVVEVAGHESIHDGDRILCDIARNQKGLYVSQIHSLEAARVKQFSGEVTRLFQDRAYGFVHVPEIGTDAFFHYSLFPLEARENLVEGLKVTFEATSDMAGRWQVRKVLSEVPAAVH